MKEVVQAHNNKEHLSNSFSSIQEGLFDVIDKGAILLEKQKSLIFFEQLQKARKEFHVKELDVLNMGGAHEYNFQEQLEMAQKNYEKKYRKWKKLESIADKNRNVMLLGVSTYQELLDVALWEIDEYGLDSMASFPIFTAGRGNGDPLMNCEEAQKFIRHLSYNDFKIFNQIPYLDMNLPKGVDISQDLKEKFDSFYIPLLKSGKIKTLCMMPGREKTQGCVTEHNLAKEEGIEIVYPKSYSVGTKYW